MKLKKIILTIISAALIIQLCACSGGSAQATVSQASESTVSEDTTAESEVITTAEETTAEETEPSEITLTDMIGREITITPGSYSKVVCIGAGALRMYSYIGDVSLLCGVEDIDNTLLEERPKMFDSVARPYVLAYGDTFTSLLSCG